MLGALVLLPLLVTAISLLPEITIGVPNVNDDSSHFMFVQLANAALSNGRNPFDFLLTQVDLGFPQFIYYQQLPHLAVVALNHLLLQSVDLYTLFNTVRVVLLVTFPLTVYWSMRRMGFSVAAAAISAATASLLSSDHNYGFEYDSYVWRGWGMYTQLWAMHLSFLTMAAIYRALTTGRGLALAILALSALVLSHLIYAYMMAITIVPLLLLAGPRAKIGQRAARLALIGGVSALITAYMWLPFLQLIAYNNATPYLQQYKYDSFGAEQILNWLFTGHLFDFGRLPVLTALVGVGVLAVILARSRLLLLSAVLFVGWLILYFGRPTLGGLVDLLPLGDELLLHRFVGSVDIGAILLMGVGGSLLWTAISGDGRAWRVALAGLACTLVLGPALLERISYYGLNTAWMTRVSVSIAADQDTAAILSTLHGLPPGRVFSGLPSTWGKQIHNEDVLFYNRLNFETIDSLAPPSGSLSLASDYVWDFDYLNPAHYDLYNARYVVAPRSQQVPEFLRPLKETAAYVLYEAPTTGYATFASVVSWEPVATKEALFVRNRPWFKSDLPARHEFIAYDYPSTSVRASGEPMAGCPGGGSVLDRTVVADRFDFVVECATQSPLVIKTTYHPNWVVRVDGQATPTYMVSPSFIGLTVPAGRHVVTAEYVPAPTKVPLLLLALLVTVIVVLFRKRLDRIADSAALRGQAVLGQASRKVTSGAVERVRSVLRASAVTAGGEIEVRSVGQTRRSAPRAMARRARPAFREYAATLTVVAGSALMIVVGLTQQAIGHDGSLLSANPSGGSTVALELAVYAVATVAQLVLYAILALLCWRRAVTGRGRLLVLGTPVGLMFLLLFTPPVFSVDAMSYFAHGYVGIAAGSGNAYSVLPQVLLGTPVGERLIALGWAAPPLVTPYGPFWTAIEAAIARLTADPATGVLLFKLVAAAATTGSALLIWRTLGLIRPERQLLGTTLFLWNPLILMELVGEGHNDALMIFFVLVGLYATIRAKAARGMVATTLATLVKYLPAVLVPAQLMFFWRTRASTRSIVRAVAIGALVSLVVTAALFAPFWAGVATFDGARYITRAWPSATVTGLVLAVASTALPAPQAGTIASLVTGLTFAVMVVVASWRVRDSRSLILAVIRIAVLYALFASTLFYPWYLTLPLALLALSPSTWSLALILVMTALARIVAPLGDLRPEFYPFANAADVMTGVAVFGSLAAFALVSFPPARAWLRRTVAAAVAGAASIRARKPSAVEP